MNRATEIAAIKPMLSGYLTAHPEIRRAVIETPNWATGDDRINIWVLPFDDGMAMVPIVKAIVDHEIARLDHQIRGLDIKLRGIGTYVPYKLDVRGVISSSSEFPFHEIFNEVRGNALGAVDLTCRLNAPLDGEDMSLAIMQKVNDNLYRRMEMIPLQWKPQHVFKLTAAPLTAKPYVQSMTTAPICRPEDVEVRLYPYSQQDKYFEHYEKQRDLPKFTEMAGIDD